MTIICSICTLSHNIIFHYCVLSLFVLVTRLTQSNPQYKIYLLSCSNITLFRSTGLPYILVLPGIFPNSVSSNFHSFQHLLHHSRPAYSTCLLILGERYLQFSMSKNAVYKKSSSLYQKGTKWY